MGKKQNKTTFGTLTLSLFWMIIISGFILAIPFDVNLPYLSISKIMVGNPWASFTRNLHYWSSQFFLVFILLHLFEHFHFREKIELKAGLSLRLSLGVLIIFLALLTGFLLKADNDSLQARRILESLIKFIPFVGDALAFSLLGNEGSFQLIYVHHIATLTVFIAFITFEHSRKIWPPITDTVLTIIVISGISYFFNAPLHDNLNPVTKGPWYFVGFQEILHWLKHPGWSVAIVLLILILIYLVNAGKEKTSLISKRTLLLFTALYLISTITGLFFRGENWKWTFPGTANYNQSVMHNFRTSRVNFNPDYAVKEIAESSEIMGRKESCLLCHTKVFGLTVSHNPEVIGCFSCHVGNPFATVKTEAHRKMINIPGNLSDAKQSCGTAQCHPEIVERVPNSLMSTLSGVISVNRMVFNEQTDPDLLTNVHSLQNTAADKHLRNLCANCHLGNQKKEYGPVTEMTRGGGCLACHLNYSKQAETALKSGSKYIRAHPEISLKVSNNHCFNCHSRSGRISTNYEGWHETLLTAAEMPDSANYRLVQGYRVFTKIQEDVHHKLGLECIDCHHSYELMGDGKLYSHKENQQDVQCSDCHFSGEPRITLAKDLDNESAIIASLRFENINDKKFLTTQKFGRPLINTNVKNDTAFFVTKNGGKVFSLKSPAAVCTKTKAHSSLSCSSCHTSWVSSCIGCHNSFDKNAPGYDLLENKNVKGTWVETKGTFTAKLPALGIRETENGEEVIPVVPGMALTIDKKTYTNDKNDTVIFHRLFAPVAPHTTSLKGRYCKSCHNNPEALGYGEGLLVFNIKEGKGKWEFTPRFENDVNDNLPIDAWIDFLETRSRMVSTRKNVFPFTVEQQKKILTVGACLTCHKEDSEVMLKSLNDFEKLVSKRKPQCCLPVW
jgi:hypothetical protein